MKRETYFLLIPMALLIMQSCSSPDRKDRDESETAKSAVVASTADTTDRAQAATADVSMNGDEKKFVLNAASSSLLEEAAAAVVVQKSQNQEIKGLADRLKKEYAKINMNVTKIAGGKGMEGPALLSEVQQKQVDDLKNLSGRALDVQYLKMQIKTQADAVALYTDGAKLNNADLRSFAAQALPAVKENWEAAKKIGSKLNLSNTNNGDDQLNISQEDVKK